MANPTACFCTFRCTDLQKYVTNATTDVFLASYTALELAVGLHGLPWVLQPELHDHQTGQGLFELLTEHANAAAAGYDALIARVSCPVARDFCVKTMCRNYAKRQTPEQALQHPWLADIAAVVQDRAAAVAPLYQQQTQLLVELFSTVPAVIMPQQEQTTLRLPIKQQQEEDTITGNEAGYSDRQLLPSVAQRGEDAAYDEVGCAATTADIPANAADQSTLEAHSMLIGSNCTCMQLSMIQQQ